MPPTHPTPVLSPDLAVAVDNVLVRAVAELASPGVLIPSNLTLLSLVASGRDFPAHYDNYRGQRLRVPCHSGERRETVATGEP